MRPLPRCGSLKRACGVVHRVADPMRHEAHAVDAPKRGVLDATSPDVPDNIAPDAREAKMQRPGRRRTRISLIQPAGPGPIAGDRTKERGQRRSVTVVHKRLRAEVKSPTGSWKPPA